MQRALQRIVQRAVQRAVHSYCGLHLINETVMWWTWTHECVRVVVTPAWPPLVPAEAISSWVTNGDDSN